MYFGYAFFSINTQYSIKYTTCTQSYIIIHKYETIGTFRAYKQIKKSSAMIKNLKNLGLKY